MTSIKNDQFFDAPTIRESAQEIYCLKTIESANTWQISRFRQTLKFKKAGYLLRFSNSIINEFQKGKDHRDESFIILPDLFRITKPFVSIEIPYFELNELNQNSFWRNFTNSLTMVSEW